MARFPDFRQIRGLAPKPTVRCETCGTEHYGRCRFFRSQRYRKATPEQIKRYAEAAKAHKSAVKVRWWVKKLTEAVDEARSPDRFRRKSQQTRAAKERKRVARRADRGVAAADLSSGEKAK